MRQIADIFRTFLTLALPYFRSEEKWQARGLLAGVVVAEFGVVYALVAFNHWNGYFFNAIQDRNWNAFLFSLLLFAGIAADLALRWRRRSATGGDAQLHPCTGAIRPKSSAAVDIVGRRR